MIYWIAYFFLKVFSYILYPLKVRHKENIPSRGSFIFASNHKSNMDPMLVGLTLYRKVSYMAKDSLFKNRIGAFFIRKFGAFPVRRGRPDRGALKEALRRLAAGDPLVLFPQGTRSAGHRKSGEAGLGFLAVKARVPIVPVRIFDSNKVLPKGGRFLRPHPVTIVIGRPRYFDKSTPYEDITQQVLDAIFSLKKEV